LTREAQGSLVRVALPNRAAAHLPTLEMRAFKVYAKQALRTLLNEVLSRRMLESSCCGFSANAEKTFSPCFLCKLSTSTYFAYL
jgi:hypothetical protein